METDTLKQRLDGLRKAKNTTIVKREREEVRIHSPHLGQLRAPQQPLPKLHRNNSHSSIHSEGNGASSLPNKSVMEKELLEQLEESRRERDRLSGELLSCRCEWEKKERTLSVELQAMEKRNQEEVASLKEELKRAKQTLLSPPSLSLSLSLLLS